MERWGYPLFYAVVSDQNRPEREIRGIVRELKSDIVQAQRETGTPPYWLEMSEGEPAFHSNILFPLGGQQPQRIINRISRSKPYPGSTLLLQSAQGSEWFVAYCSKERAPQAKWVGGIKMHKRLPGSHTLGEGGGDRVKLSQALKKDLLAKGQKPWKRDYASRSLPPLAVKIHEPDPHGLFGLLHDQARPNLKPSYHRAKIADHPHQMQFPFIRLVPDVIDLLANLAPTHEQIAEKIGRSRSQVTNIINRQFRPSKAVVRHVLSLASAA